MGPFTGRQQPKSQDFGPIVTDETRGETAALLHQMEPDVQAARQKLFKNAQVPFPSWTAARAWIKRESAHQSAADTGRAWKVYERACSACAALTELTGRQYRVEPPKLACRRFEDPPPVGQVDVDYIRVTPSSALGQLKQIVGSLAEGSGFGEEDILAHVLVGYRPFLPSYELWIRHRTLPGGSTRPIVELTLNVQDVPWKELRELYRAIRKILSRQHPSLKLTERESKLVAAVHIFGGKPKRSGAWEAWEQLAKKTGYPNGQAARVAYGRILRKRDSNRKQRVRN